MEGAAETPEDPRPGVVVIIGVEGTLLELVAGVSVGVELIGGKCFEGRGKNYE